MAHEQQRDFTKMQRAYSRLEVKFQQAASDPDEIEIVGTASTPATDREGDIVEPLGAKFTMPMPLLWQHMSLFPIGLVNSAEVSAKGIGFVASAAKSGVARHIDEARNMLRAGLVRAVSIGFIPKDYEPVDEADPYGGQRFRSWEWLELSVVTIPTNQEATIHTIKQFDAALGIDENVRRELHEITEKYNRLRARLREARAIQLKG